ncbi:Ig domain-containing protein [Sphingobacterium sp. SGG-5]|uniref:Ig-like domain-containing protein n=1 Tax=Sphingobacterium sp. SGG-5 TaxID=2710881 RepID=UPI0013EE1254|nr:Ig-like domain-containing protein [Sphingobacterium sp. SGG-5]NGM63329.1 Ig domain-containing protein [Sphingobacterium sp. SGG-5]
MKRQNLLILLLGAIVFSVSCGKDGDKDIVTPDGILLNNNTLSLAAGESETLTATLTPKGAEGTVSWTSDKPEVATVDDKGLVTAVAEGTAIVEATVGSHSAQCTVTVTEEDVVIVDLNLASITYGGASLEGFQGNVLSYDVELPEGTVDAPQVAATAVAVASTEVTVTQAEALPGTATVVVAEKANTANKKTYVINFTVDDGSNPGSGDAECSGSSTVNLEGQPAFDTNGYTYSFKTAENGKDVIVEFELLDDQIGVVAFAWLYNPDFAEAQLDPVAGNDKKFTKTFTAADGTTVFKMACKFAFAGGMAVTKVFEYKIGEGCN